jgi:hypothetical protein
MRELQVAVLPSRMPPASRNFAATTASSAGMWSASSLDCPVVRMPIVSTMSLRQ